METYKIKAPRFGVIRETYSGITLALKVIFIVEWELLDE